MTITPPTPAPTATRVSMSALVQLRDQASRLEAEIAATQQAVRFLRTALSVVDGRLSDMDAATSRQVGILWQRIELQDATIRELRARLETRP